MNTKRTSPKKCSFCKRSEKKAGLLLQASPSKRKGVSFIPRICERCAMIALHIFIEREKKEKGAPDATDTPTTQGENPHD